jgi:hypothetical protein
MSYFSVSLGRDDAGNLVDYLSSGPLQKTKSVNYIKTAAVQETCSDLFIHTQYLQAALAPHDSNEYTPKIRNQNLQITRNIKIYIDVVMLTPFKCLLFNVTKIAVRMCNGRISDNGIHLSLPLPEIDGDVNTESRKKVQCRYDIRNGQEQ